MQITFFKELRSRLRHHLYPIFRRRYVYKNLKQRKGECKQCGTCCRVSFFGIRCPFFKDEDNKCIIHNNLKPYSCRIAFFDKKDRYFGLIPELNKACGYYWEEDESNLDNTPKSL
jgi:Fe-S-cluster containining protein